MSGSCGTSDPQQNDYAIDPMPSAATLPGAGIHAQHVAAQQQAAAAQIAAQNFNKPLAQPARLHGPQQGLWFDAKWQGAQQGMQLAQHVAAPDSTFTLNNILAAEIERLNQRLAETTAELECVKRMRAFWHSTAQKQGDEMAALKVDNATLTKTLEALTAPPASITSSRDALMSDQIADAMASIGNGRLVP